jgi:hypothetical protein
LRNLEAVSKPFLNLLLVPFFAANLFIGIPLGYHVCWQPGKLQFKIALDCLIVLEILRIPLYFTRVFHSYYQARSRV